MSEETTKAPGVEIDYFIRDHLPQASWIVGGAFRFDVHLLVLVNYLASFFKPRRIARVAGAPPCPWSLDMLEPRAPMSPRACASIISSYAEARVGLLLVFDNPSISPENREDAFGIWLVQELTKKANNPTGRNGVVVADDSLAELLRRKFPKLTIICHPNRLIMSNDKRTAEIYGTLCEKYTQVVLHPRDAVLPSIYTRLKYPERVIAIVNDPVPRRYPSRRDLINLAIQLRKNPYNYELVESMHRLHERTGLFTDEDTCNLTKNEEASLYRLSFSVMNSPSGGICSIICCVRLRSTPTKRRSLPPLHLPASARMSIKFPPVSPSFLRWVNWICSKRKTPAEHTPGAQIP